MKIIDKKTRKSLEKSLGKYIRKHAPAIAAGLVSGLASSIATLASTSAPDGQQSNLSKVAAKVQEALGVEGDDTHAHKHSDKARLEKKTRRHSDSTHTVNGLPA